MAKKRRPRFVGEKSTTEGFIRISPKYRHLVKGASHACPHIAAEIDKGVVTTPFAAPTEDAPRTDTWIASCITCAAHWQRHGTPA